MNFEDLQHQWKQEGADVRLPIRSDLLLREIRRNQAAFYKEILWRDFREFFTSFLCGGLFVFFGYRLDWSFFVSAAGMVYLAAFFVLYRRFCSVKAPVEHASLRDSVEDSLRELELQIGLSRNVFWWYLLWPSMGLVFPLLKLGFMQPTLSEVPPVVWMTLFLFILVSAGVYWANRYQIRKVLLPRRQELGDWLENLGGPSPSIETGKQRGVWKVFSLSVLVSLLFLGIILFMGRKAEGENSYPTFDETVRQMAPGEPLPPTAEELIRLAEACPAEIGFYGRNFTTGKDLAYRADQPACLASIVKLFVLAELSRQLEAGEVEAADSVTITYEDREERCSLQEAVDRMIGVSDNEATAALAGLVGYDRVNALAGELGLEGISETILPEGDGLGEVLDSRVFEQRMVPTGELPPQHGTARGIVGFFERLHEKTLVSEAVSRRVLEGLMRNPKPFAPKATPAGYHSVGKGGSLLWIRPPRPHYNMLGWGIYIYSEEEALAFCLWSEWFPEDMDEARRHEWMYGLSDGIVNLLLLPENRTLSN